MTPPLAFLLGAVVVLVYVGAWTWWAEVRHDVSWAAFWRPVRDVEMHGRPWMQVHLVAHLLGGAAIALFLLGPWWADGYTDALWKRACWLVPVQAAWERIQHENWKTGAGSSDYPWWSAVWDVLITVAGWLAVEGGRVLVRAVLA